MRRLSMLLIAAFACLPVAIAFAMENGAGEPMAQASAARQTAQEPQLRQIPGIKPERVREALDAVERNLEAVRTGADFNPADLRLVNAFQEAMLASDIKIVAAGRLPRHVKGITPERLQQVEAASARVLAEFNEHGGDASFEDSDLRLLQGFMYAVLAVETSHRLASPTERRGMDPELVREARATSPRVLAEFNANGADARFQSDDIETLKKTRETLEKRKRGSPK